MDTTQDSLLEQLCDLYAEREALDAHFPGMSVAEIIESANDVRATLAALGEGPFVRLNAPRQELPSESTDSLEAQVVELYAEKQALTEAFPGMEIDDIAADFKTKLDRIEQLHRAPSEVLATAA